MTDQLSGLRFDIYERVNLPDDVAAIEELEEIELVPHMQALPQDDHVLLRGHLLLSGVYRSQQTRSESQLEHWIPVEISLPLNRIGKVEDLAVEIDNFDVDLISTRTLNVTGVLALRGLQVSSPQAPVWRDDSFTVVHQAQPDPEPEQYAEQVPAQERFQSQDELSVDEPYSAEADSYAGQESKAQNDLERPDPSAGEAQAGPPPEAEKPNGWLSMFQNTEPLTKEKETEYRSADNQEDTPAATYSDNEIDRRAEDTEQTMDEEEAAAWAAVEADLKQQPEERPENGSEHFQEEKPQPKLEDRPEEKPQLKLEDRPEEKPQPKLEDRPEEKPELKLPAVAKPVDTVIRIQSGVGLLSQLGENGAKREAELREQEAAETEQKAAAAQNSAAPTTGDELEWTRLFLSYGAEANTFKKLKLCIVQREETLDAIANRYNVQPRELQLYNRLHDPYLSEGQVLYIPLAR